MAMRLISATGQRLAALALLAALCACATTATELPTEMRPAGWRIVERTGEARYSPPEGAVWVSATTGQALAGGSEVATGRGGRLIVDAPGRHISVGPDSRFVLPDGDRDEWLEQRAGWLRYRIAEAGAQPFRIYTRSLELELSSGVVDVHVNHLATEVTVMEGQVRVATPDGLRQSQMIAGQSARAGGTGNTELAVRLAPGQALQPVEPVIVPALHSKRKPADASATRAPPSSPTAAEPAHPSLEPAVTPSGLPQEPLVLRQATASRNARAHSVLSDPPPPAEAALEKDDADLAMTAATAGRPRGRADAADRVVEAIQPGPKETGPAAIRRSKFERLTAGMIDGIQPPYPAPSQHRPIR